jgi:hypothetical protein
VFVLIGVVDDRGSSTYSLLLSLLRIDGVTRRLSDACGDVNFCMPMVLVCSFGGL